MRGLWRQRRCLPPTAVRQLRRRRQRVSGLVLDKRFWHQMVAQAAEAQIPRLDSIPGARAACNVVTWRTCHTAFPSSSLLISKIRLRKQVVIPQPDLSRSQDAALRWLPDTHLTRDRQSLKCTTPLRCWCRGAAADSNSADDTLLSRTICPKPFALFSTRTCMCPHPIPSN